MKLFRISLFLLGCAASAQVLALDYQHVRNATAKIEYAGQTFLLDPYLAEQGTYAGFEGTVNSSSRNPMIAMKFSAEEVLKGVDAVIVTHTHDDHWDKAAQQAIPKNMPVFVQNVQDAKAIREQGFEKVSVLGVNTEFNGVKLTRIKGGQHGTDAMYSVPQLVELLGDAMGVVFQAPSEKTLYIVGDTIWNKSVEQTFNQYKPQVAVLNTGYAKLEGMDGGIIMGKDDVAKAAKFAPKSKLITVHMDAVNHATVSSDEMRQFVKQNNLTKKVSVPETGEVLKF